VNRFFQLEAYLTKADIKSKSSVPVGSIVMQVRHSAHGYMILAMLQSLKKIIRLNTLIVSADEGRMTTVEVSPTIESNANDYFIT